MTDVPSDGPTVVDGPTGRPSTRSLPELPLIDVAPTGARATPQAVVESVLPTPFERYELGSEIGRGGMGRILTTRDRNLRRQLVMKQVLPRASGQPGLLRRFITEARITAQLEHPNIVPVHELGRTPDGGLYFTMKRVEGRTLTQVLRALRDGDPETQARYGLVARLGLFAAICNAVGFAHSRGVVHRDLKPDNVMVGEFGQVLVMDWGLAKLRDPAPTATSSEALVFEGPRPARPDGLVFEGPGSVGSAAARTQDGQILGTPHYMSPEQARGELDAVDATSDVYALGLILSELLVLRQALDVPTRQGPMAVVLAASQGELTLPGQHADDPDVPRELIAVACKALAFDRAERYPGVPELVADIDAYLAGFGVSAQRDRWHVALARWIRRHRALAGAVAASLLTLTAGLTLGYGVLRRQQRAASDRDVAAATRLLDARAADVDRLQTAWRRWQAARQPGDPDRVEPPAERERRRAAIADHLEAIRRLDRVLASRPAHEAGRRLRVRAGRGLGTLAMIGRDDTLAVWAYAQLADHGVDPAEAARLVTQARGLQTRLQAERATRLDAILADVEAGLSRPDRAASQPSLDDYVQEVLAFGDLATVARLQRALDPLLASARQRGQRALWSQRDRDLADLVCRVLGRSRHAPARATLIRWLDVLHDRDLILATAEALGTAREPAALAPITRALERIGDDVAARARLTRALVRLPEATASGRETEAELEARARRRWFRGDHLGALADVDRILARNARHATAINLRGAIRHDRGDHTGAIADFTAVLALAGELPAVHVDRGVARWAQGNIEGAMTDFARAIALDPRCHVAYEKRAALRLERGRWRDALADATAALGQPGAARYALRGRIRVKLTDFEGAMVDFDEAIRLDPQATYYQDRGAARSSTGDTRGAINDFSHAIRREPGLAWAYYNRGIARRQLGEYTAGLQDLDQALRLEPRNVGFRFMRGRLYLALGRVDEALADHERAVELNPSAPEGHVGQGEVHLQAGRTAAARAAFERAIAVAPRRPEGHAGLGEVLTRTGEPDAALRSLTHAIGLDPGLADPYFRRGLVYQALGQPARALADFETAIRIAPYFPQPLIARALMRAQSGDRRAALKDMERAVALDRGEWSAWANLALVRSRLGDHAEAVVAMRKARDLAPAERRPALAQELRSLEARRDQER